jgi:N,N-dimethylformamidase
LEPYDAVLTGSHPEYVSSRMMETLQQFVDGGGHLMYLGGNGFYQVTSFHPDMPHVIEVRRAFSGHRNHTSQPGESAHAFTGDIGGLWRYRGLGSHRLTGVGSGALGFGKAGPYKLTAAARSEEHAWIFEGVSDDLIGAQGMMLGGAAGDEIDRTDASNGTPPQTVVLASSVGLSSHYQEFIEDVIMILPGENGTSSNPKVRADMTWLATRGGGAVFSVGSICWIGCLPINGYDNAVSRVTLNVLKRFTRKSAAC